MHSFSVLPPIAMDDTHRRSNTPPSLAPLAPFPSQTGALELDRQTVITIQVLSLKVRLPVSDMNMNLADFRKKVMELLEPHRTRLGIQPGHLDLALQPAYQRTVLHIKPVVDGEGSVQKLGMQVEWNDDLEEGNAVYDVRGDVSGLRIADLLLFKADTRVHVVAKGYMDQGTGKDMIIDDVFPIGIPWLISLTLSKP